MARTIHNDGTGGIKFCDCCTECVCANCQAGTVSCPTVVGRVQGEDLQSAHATDVTSGASFPTFVFDDAGFTGLTVEIVSVQYPTSTKNFAYRGNTDIARRDNLKSDMEAWFAIAYGGVWTFDVQISGAGLIIDSVSCIASVTNISEMFFYEDLSGSHESNHVDFNNTPHVNACVTAAMLDTLWTTGAVHSGTTPCNYQYTAALGSGCGNLISTISIGPSVISMTVQINDDLGEVVSATFQSNTCGPFECDAQHSLQINAFNVGEDPNGNSLVDWTGATATYAAGEPTPVVPCAIPSPPDITTLTMLGETVPCDACSAGTPVTVPLAGLISGTNLLGVTSFEVKDYNSFNPPTISGSTLTWEPLFEDTAVCAIVQATNNGIKDSAGIIFESACCGCASIVPSISTDTTPSNPCVIPTVVSYLNTNPCVNVLYESLTVTHAGGTESIPLPIPGNNLNFGAYAGETVTITYSVVTDCGTEFVTEDIILPSFANTYTVNTGLPDVPPNYHSITDAAAAMSNGDRLIIEPATYVLTGAAILDFNNHDNICVSTSSGVAVIDAASAAVFTQGNVRASGSDNAYIGNLEIINAAGRALYTQDASNQVFENINVTSTRGIKDTVNGRGLFLYNAQGSKIIGGTATLNEATAIEISGLNSFATYSQDVLVYGYTGVVNNQDGIQVRNARNTTITNCEFGLNKRSGMILIQAGCQGVTIDNNNVYENEDCGIQCENEASNLIIRNNLIRGNNTYYTGGSGEAGLWIDQNSNVLIEYNEITQNHTGIRIASNLFGSDKTEANDVIVRYNRVYDNNAQISNDYSGNESSIEFRHVQDVYVYHNTFSGNGNTSSSGGVGKNGVEFFPNTTYDPGGGDPVITGIVSNAVHFLNNIVTDVVAKDAARNISINALSELDLLDGNLYFGTPAALPYEIAGVSYDWANYQAQTSGVGFEKNSINADPLLDAELTPGSGSPAISGAIPLANITYLSSPNLGVTYPKMFYPGDIVEFEDKLTARVISIGGDHIVVDAIPPTAAINQGITLYTCNGSDEIGAVQIPLDSPTSRFECASCTGSEGIMPAEVDLTISGVENIPYPSDTQYWDFETLGSDIAAWVNQTHRITLSCYSFAGAAPGAPVGYASRIFQANAYSPANAPNNPYDVKATIWIAMQTGAQWRYSIFISNVNEDSPPTATFMLAQNSQFDGVNNGANCLLSDSADYSDLVIGSLPDRYLDTTGINITMIPVD